MTKNAAIQPFFSIVSITLNNLSGLRQTQKSLENQICRDFEWIVMDGGSTDGTPEHLKTTDAHWISEPDDGLYDAMNKGLSRAQGRYVLFLNAGDALAGPEVLENIKDAAKEENPAFIYGDALENNHYKAARKPDSARGMFTHHQAMLYRRDALADLRYDLSYKIAADYEFTARFLSAHNDIVYCAFPICIFEPGGVSQTQATCGRREQYQIRKKLKLVSPLTNWTITAQQAALWTLRRCAPGLYWHLKSCGNTAPASAQNDTPPRRPETPA